MIKQKPDGRWRVDIEPIKGKRFRKTFDTKAECKRYEAALVAKYAQNPLWIDVRADKRTLVDVVDLWYSLHGHTLKDSTRRYHAVLRIAHSLGNPVASRLASSAFLLYRKQRLQDGLTPKTLNNELIYLRSVYNELLSLQQINYPNPLDKVKPLKVPDRELSWLTQQQIDLLRKTVQDRTALNQNPHLPILIDICLSTGARWSEAENITASALRNNQITFVKTKSNRNRTIPISADLSQRIVQHWSTHGDFTSSIGAFRRVLVKSGIDLPSGQATHVLRHTFASHFVMNGGNIVTLQKILGHSSVKTTMRYAHLCPDFLNDSLRLNPLSFDTFTTPEDC